MSLCLLLNSSQESVAFVLRKNIPRLLDQSRVQICRRRRHRRRRCKACSRSKDAIGIPNRSWLRSKHFLGLLTLLLNPYRSWQSFIGATISVPGLATQTKFVFIGKYLLSTV